MVVLSVAILLGALIYLIFPKYKNPTKTENIELRSNSSDRILDYSEGWKTYRNNDLKFEFKYPESLIVLENNSSVVLGHKNNEFFEAVITVSTDTDDYINRNLYKECGFSAETLPDYPCVADWNVEFDGNETLELKSITKFQYAIGQDGGYFVVQRTEDPKVELKSVSAGGGLEMQFITFVSTFKFIE